MWHSCFSCKICQKMPARHSSLFLACCKDPVWHLLESVGTVQAAHAPVSKCGTAKVAQVLVMYQLVTVLLKLGQVAFSSAGSWWHWQQTARNKLLTNSAPPEVSLTLILEVHRAEANKALRTTVGTSWSARLCVAVYAFHLEGCSQPSLRPCA